MLQRQRHPVGAAESDTTPVLPPIEGPKTRGSRRKTATEPCPVKEEFEEMSELRICDVLLAYVYSCTH